ncbi:MAG: DNA primase [Candidatus Babeliales bacterium]|nr:DNA primase [Candidatus Babeliales bacterium]
MDLFNFIRTQLPILDVVSEYTTLKQSGHYFKGNCPFHSEKTASFSVSPHKDIFYCFGCHATGDVVGFLSKIENCSQFEAAKFLVERYNLKVPTDVTKDFEVAQKSEEEKKRYFILCSLVAQWCHDNLNNNKVAFDYVKDRGFEQNSINKYLMGYFPGGHLSLKNLLNTISKHGFLAHDLIKANIIAEGRNTLYSPFEERIMFPIRDLMGRFCGFGGRIFKENDERAKYYNSHENEFFDKGSLLFGLDLAKKAIQESGRVYLVEGYVDCIIMSQNNYNNTIAVLGTSCTTEHLKILSRFTKEIYVLYDGDNAGRNAMLRLTEMCWGFNLDLRVVSLPDKDDPASFLLNGGDLGGLINSAQDIYSFFIESSSSNFYNKSLQEKIWTVKKIIDIIRNIDDSLKRDILLQEVSSKLNIPVESLKKESMLESKKLSWQNKEKQDKENIEDEEYQADVDVSEIEKKLITEIMHNFDLLTPDNFYLVDYFSSPAKEILYALIDLKNPSTSSGQAGHVLDFNNFIKQLDEDKRQFVSKLLFEHKQERSNNFKNLLLQFQKKNWKRIAYSIKLQIEQAQKNSDIENIKVLLNNFQELKKKLLNGEKNG